MNFTKPQHIRLVIAEDFEGLRVLLRQRLEREADIEVVREAEDGVEAVKLARQLKPDILTACVAMPNKSGFEVLRELNATPVAGLGVILWTAHTEKVDIVTALTLGARGFVFKPDKPQVVLKAIRTVMAGGYWVHREPVSNLEQYLRTLTQSTHDEARQKEFGLTPRELEIVSAVVAGYSNKEIADYCKIGEETVRHHLSNIFDKLGVSSRLELALFADRNGFDKWDGKDGP